MERVAEPPVAVFAVVAMLSRRINYRSVGRTKSCTGHHHENILPEVKHHLRCRCFRAPFLLVHSVNELQLFGEVLASCRIIVQVVLLRAPAVETSPWALFVDFLVSRWLCPLVACKVCSVVVGSVGVCVSVGVVGIVGCRCLLFTKSPSMESCAEVRPGQCRV